MLPEKNKLLVSIVDLIKSLFAGMLTIFVVAIAIKIFSAVAVYVISGFFVVNILEVLTYSSKVALLVGGVAVWRVWVFG